MNPAVKDELRFFPMGSGVYHVYDPTTLRHSQMGEEQVSWLKLLNGQRSKEELRGEIPAEYFEDFFLRAASMGLLKGAGSKRQFDLFKIRFTLLDPSRILDKIANWTISCRKLLNLTLPLLFLLNTIFLLGNWQKMLQPVLSTHFVPWVVFLFYLVGILFIGFSHEACHSIVAKSYGITTPAVGVMLFYLNPAFYADVSGIALLKNRLHRINVLAAGVMANNLLVSVSILAFFWFHAIRPYLVAFILMNAVLIFVNLIPFIEFDGYYILLELLGESDFGIKARRSLRGGPAQIEYVLYFLLSRAFSLAIVFLAFATIRRYSLHFMNSSFVNYLCAALMILASIALMRRGDANLKTRKD